MEESTCQCGRCSLPPASQGLQPLSGPPPPLLPPGYVASCRWRARVAQLYRSPHTHLLSSSACKSGSNASRAFSFSLFSALQEKMQLFPLGRSVQIPSLFVRFLDDVKAKPHYSDSAQHDDSPAWSSVWEMTRDPKGLVASLGRHVLPVVHSSHAKQHRSLKFFPIIPHPRHVIFTWADFGRVVRPFEPVNKV